VRTLRRLDPTWSTQARRCHDRRCWCARNKLWWPHYNPRLADHPPQEARRSPGMIRRFSAKTARVMDAATGAALALDGLARLEPALLSGKPSPAAGYCCIGCSPVKWPPSMTSAPATPIRSAVQSCPARDPSPAPGRAWPMWTMPAMPAAQREQLHLKRPGPLGRTGAPKPCKRGNPPGRQHASVLGAPANGSPANFYAGVAGSAPPLPRPGDRRQTETP